VGYGDVYPVTVAGKILGGIIAILGIGLVALPTGIISSGFVNAIGDKDKKTICPHCGKEIE
jgi:voltage-gated potassium channel